ncbi:tetratricopeptide repeat protein [Thioploca ingrica]|uniref:Tetratricopeptide repeat protein n=1 Tax=Thioploca ingrica TaxID=40754 RepID=A0A090AG89_9GAMM|nr:tetratricopeptide repeat protein [Thioploca ingrica]
MLSNPMSVNSTPNHTQLLLQTWYIQTLLLAIVVALTYGHTLDVPFYLDDFSSIEENPVIYNSSGLLALWQFAPLRIVGYLSFALNYQIHQFQVAGYHLVNIIIHFFAGMAVFGLLRGLVRTPAVNLTLSASTQQWLPILTALIFVLHPLQIQAVTYIVQRLASLSALFYIASMASFIQARLTDRIGQRVLWILACIFLALLAFFTKQNTATLPLTLLLLELIFFPGHKRRLMMVTGIAGLGLGCIWFILAVVFHHNPFSLESMQALTRETEEVTRTAYFATQMSVLWTYIKLFFWSSSSHIDYYYPITETFLSTQNYNLIARLLDSVALWALIGHLLVLGWAGYSLRRWPLVAFGIFFYYLAHLIESSFIPIRDVIFEHRTYLPNLGLIIASSWLLVVYLPRWVSQKTTLTIIILLLVMLGITTKLRNQMWRDPIALWQHNVEQSPDKQRGWVILGKHLIQAERSEEAIEALNHAVTKKVNPDGTESLSVSTETALNFVVAYKRLHRYDEALQWIDRSLALKDQLRPFDQAKFLINRGNILFELKHNQEAENSYRLALQIYPQNLNARINLGTILAATGRYDEAIALYQEILAIDPSNAYVKSNLEKLQKLRH